MDASLRIALLNQAQARGWVWRRRAGRGGTHVAILVAVEVVIMVSFSFVARSTLAITAPSERLCDKNK